MVFEVLRALVKGRGGGWVCVGGVCTSVTATLHCDDTTAGCPYLVLRCRRQSGREIGIAERERKGDMTQGHMDTSGGVGVT